MTLNRTALHRLLAAMALLLVSAASSPARAEPASLEPSRSEELFTSPRADIDDATEERPWRAQAGTIADALEEMPGVFLRRLGSADILPILGGLQGHQTLVLIDGIPLNNASTGARSVDLLGTIAPFNIDRVTLLRGPRSVLFGSGAMGGVISLTTRRPAFDRRRAWDLAGQAVARYDTAAAGFGGYGAVEGHLRQIGLRAGGSFSRSGDLRVGRGSGEQPFTGQIGGSANVSARWDMGEAGDLLLSYDLVRQGEVPRPYLSSAADFQLTDQRMRDLIALRYAGRFDAFVTRAEATVSYHLHRQRWQRFLLAGDRVERESDQVGSIATSLRLVSDLPYNSLAYGLDFAYDHLDSSVEQEAISSRTVTQYDRGRFVNGSLYTHFGAYALDRLSLGKLAFDLGGRAAGWNARVPGVLGVDATDWAVVGTLHGRYLVGDGLNLVAGVSQGFRAPTLDDYSAQGCGIDRYDVPNDDEIRSERSVTFEAGVKLDLFGRLQGTLLYAFTHIDDMIAPRPATIDTGSGPVAALACGTNIDGTPRILPIVKRENAQGAVHTVEGALRLLLDRRFAVFGSVAWARGQTTFESVGNFSEPMDRVPPLNGLWGVRYTSQDQRWAAQVAMRWALRQDRLSSADKTDPATCPSGTVCRGTAGYAALDLRGAVRLHELARLTLSVQNLTDELYRHHGSGIDAPGLNAILGLEVWAR